MASSSRRSASDKRKGKRMPLPPIEDLFAAYFEKLPDPIAGDLKVICNYCARLFTFRAETEDFGALTNHLNRKHHTKIRNHKSQTQPHECSLASTGTHSATFTYSYTRARKIMAKFICAASLPFGFTDTDSFEILVKSYNPLATKIPRSEIIREIRKLVRESLLVLIKDFVKLPNKVSICCDIWCDHWGLCDYVGITCHWIDDCWIIQKRLIAFKCLSDGVHTAAEISHEMLSVLQYYGLDSKVFSISFDNNTDNAYSLETLTNACQPSIRTNFFHVRSMSYVLAMCAEDALNVLEEDIAPIRNAALCLWGSHSLTRKWATFCKKKGLCPRRFLPDFRDRWDLTYRMLNGCYEYRDALCSFFSEHHQCEDVDIFSDQYWDACSNLCKLLGVFYRAIEELSRVYHPTSVLVVDHCVHIAVVFNTLMSRDGLRECVGEMIAKWSKYFHEIPTIFLVAKTLDPRIRLHGLEKMLEIYYDALFPIKDEKTPIPSVIVANVRKCLYDIFEEYRMKHGDKLGINLSSSNDGDKMKPLSVRLQELYGEISEKRQKSYGPNRYGELENYLTVNFEYVIESEFDVLKWWSRMAMQLPIMSLIAKDILAVPASIVSVEQAFSSTGGHALNKRQSTLSLRNLENQLMLGDWTKAENRSQENDYYDGDESETVSDSDSDSDTDSLD